MAIELFKGNTLLCSRDPTSKLSVCTLYAPKYDEKGRVERLDRFKEFKNVDYVRGTHLQIDSEPDILRIQPSAYPAQDKLIVKVNTLGDKINLELGDLDRSHDLAEDYRKYAKESEGYA